MSLFPFLAQPLAITPSDLKISRRRPVCHELEPSGEDKTVELVFPALNNNATLRDGVNSMSIGVHEGDIGLVKTRQVIVMKTSAYVRSHGSPKGKFDVPTMAACTATYTKVSISLQLPGL